MDGFRKTLHSKHETKINSNLKKKKTNAHVINSFNILTKFNIIEKKMIYPGIYNVRNNILILNINKFNILNDFHFNKLIIINYYIFN